MAKSTAIELPTHKTPGWEFTDLSGLDLSAFTPAKDGSREDFESTQLLVPVFEGATRIDQIDGLSLGVSIATESEINSDTSALPTKPVVLPLSQAQEIYPDLVKKYLGTVVSADDPFVAHNNSIWQGGAFVYLPPGTVLEQPIQINTVQFADGSSLGWRTLIVLEEGAQAEVWEQYGSTSEKTDGLFNTVVELVVGDGANLRYVCGQGLSEKSWIFGSQRAEVGRDANIEWIALGFGSGNGKVRMETKLAGRGSSAKVTGAYAGHNGQHLDFDTTQEHAAENTTSDLAFKGVLQDTSTAVWRGMIKVDPGAQKTDAFQESRNLLLSTDAHADSIPGLEIEADDVRCTHAAAVAKIDPEQLFYLRSRGLNKEVAGKLIIEGFMQAIVERLPEGPIHDAVSNALRLRMEQILG